MTCGDHPLFDPINNDILKDYPDIVNFNKTVKPVYDNDGTLVLNDSFYFFLLYLQKGLSNASILKEPYTTPFIDGDQVELIGEIDSFSGILACVILKYHNTLMVLFKGTTQKSESVVDTILTQTTINDPLYGLYKVHSGFLQYFQLFKNAGVLHQIISHIADASTTIVLSGVSLGACLAKLCLVDLRSMIPNTIHCILFAPPRCGDAAFYNVLEYKLSNVALKAFVNTKDIVPKIPPLFYGKMDSSIVKFIRNNKSLINNHIVSYFDYFYIIKGCRIETLLENL